MGDYGKLLSRIWGDVDFTALNAREQQVFMMLFSFPTRTLTGIVPLTIRRWSKCTADATVENVTGALVVLIKKHFILVDWNTEEVLIRTYVRNDEVWKQPNLMTRCLRFSEAVASPSLRSALAQELVRIAQEFMPTTTDAQQRIKDATLETAKRLVKTFSEGYSDGSSETLPETLPDTFAEPFQEPIGEPPGVGGYLGEYLPPAPTPSPSTDTSTLTKPPSGVSKGAALNDEKSPPVKRGTRLPEDWKPPDDVVRVMHSEFPYVDLRYEHAKFCDYWHSKPGKDATKLDWVKAWRNWIRSAAERTPRNNRGLTGPDQKAVDWMTLGRQQEQKGLTS